MTVYRNLKFTGELGGVSKTNDGFLMQSWLQILVSYHSSLWELQFLRDMTVSRLIIISMILSTILTEEFVHT